MQTEAGHFCQAISTLGKQSANAMKDEGLCIECDTPEVVYLEDLRCAGRTLEEKNRDCNVSQGAIERGIRSGKIFLSFLNFFNVIGDLALAQSLLLKFLKSRNHEVPNSLTK